MDFREARVAMDILEKYGCGEYLEYQDGRRELITGCFDFAHDQCWISLPRTSDNPDLTDEERQSLLDANWFFDEEQEAWSHF